MADPLQETDVDIRLTRPDEGPFRLVITDRNSRNRLIDLELDAEHFADVVSNRGAFAMPARVATVAVSHNVGRKRVNTKVHVAWSAIQDLHPHEAFRTLENWAAGLRVDDPKTFGIGATTSVQAVRGGYDVIVWHYDPEQIDGLSPSEWLATALPAEWRGDR
jgi:hypothetical protein